MFVENVSTSKLSTYKECGWKYLMRYHERLPEKDLNGDAKNFGSFVHKIFEEGYQASSIEELRIIAESVKDNYNFDHKAYKGTLETCLKNFLNFNSKLTKTIGREVVYKIELCEGIQYNGVIDRILQAEDSSILIIDYKAGKRQKNKADLYSDDQLQAYAFAASKLYNVELSKITCAHYYPRTNTFVPVKYLPVQIADFVRRTTKSVWDLRKKKKEELVPRQNTFCDWCGYKYYCPLFNDNFTIQKRINEAKLSSETGNEDSNKEDN